MNKISNLKVTAVFGAFFKDRAWLLIFVFCFIYWGYLVFNTKTQVIFDSVDYENTGRIIYQKGWLEFFRSGPHREPFYPALIALSMFYAKILSLHYQFVLKVFQILLLFTTQILLIALLKKLNLREAIIRAAVFYLGISPAVLNAGFSVYYEIVVFPFVIAAVLLAGTLLSDILEGKPKRIIIGKGILFGICFTLLAFGRGVFQYIFYFFIAIFSIFAIFSFYKKKKNILLRFIVFIAVASTIFFALVSYFKAMSLRYNGEYVLGNTHFSILLASAYKRSQPLTARIVAAHIASIPGTGVCRKFFSQEECEYADWYGAEDFRIKYVLQEMEKIPKDHPDPEVFRLTLQKIFLRPFQYLFFFAVEALKMPFWESTQISFVFYPEFLVKLYNFPLTRYGLRLIIGILTLCSVIFTALKLLINKPGFFEEGKGDSGYNMLFFAWLMAAGYTFFYSLCYVLTRYALPIASMFIVCIAFMLNSLIFRGPREILKKGG